MKKKNGLSNKIFIVTLGVFVMICIYLLTSYINFKIFNAHISYENSHGILGQPLPALYVILYWITYIVTFTSPLLSGFIVGYYLKDHHLRYAALAGCIVGFFPIFLSIFYLVNPHSFLPGMSSAEVTRIMYGNIFKYLINAIRIIILCISGGYIGKQIQRRKYGNNMKISIQKPIAISVVIVIVIIASIAIYKSLFIQRMFLLLYPPRISIDRRDWIEHREERLGFKLLIPPTFTYISSLEDPKLFSLTKTITITNMKLDDSMRPKNEYVIYMPEIQGIGGSYRNDEIPIYNGIEITITLLTKNGNNFNTIANIRNSPNHSHVNDIDGAEVYAFNATFSKNGCSGKNVLVDVIKDKKVYQVQAIYLNTPQYDKVFNTILSSLHFTDTVAENFSD